MPRKRTTPRLEPRSHAGPGNSESPGYAVILGDIGFLGYAYERPDGWHVRTLGDDSALNSHVFSTAAQAGEFLHLWFVAQPNKVI